MRQLVALMLIGLFSVSTIAGTPAGTEKDKQAIKEVIQTAYVDGLQNLISSEQQVRDGFDPGFNLLGVKNNELTKYPINKWVESFKRAKQKNPEGRDPRVKCEYKMFDITGDAAMAKIELHLQGKKIFTDYLSLYRFEEGWRIVNKIYHRH
ncbi:MAG: nuclear transport factor 2 family protein [Bacteroidales bacterium]|nr:nuclear transport factor 2 family protein [Bacteroidales bacterium]